MTLLQLINGLAALVTTLAGLLSLYSAFTGQQLIPREYVVLGGSIGVLIMASTQMLLTQAL